ncbi:MAG: chemotaxis protein CheD [Burkholderiales bacterium]|nr:chemotaxis protein CheD [Burkholderiales bacterium]
MQPTRLRPRPTAARPSAQREPFDIVRHAEALHVLHPGDVLCLLSGGRMQTLLGSCVAICMTDPARRVGAMCHIVHSAPPRPGSERDTAFAEPAMRRLFAELRAHGVDPLACEAHLCGGGVMSLVGLNPANLVGERNVQWARRFLASHHIPTHEMALGGAFYRKLSWEVGQGEPTVESLPISGGG